MPVQIVDINPEEAAQEETPQQEEAPAQEEPAEEAPPPKRRGRPPGSKNKPKQPAEVQDIEEAPKAKPAEPVRMKRAVSRKVVIKEESESESEDEPPPPSPSAQRKELWANYRRSQVEAHQARTEHYTKALDKVLGF